MLAIAERKQQPVAEDPRKTLQKAAQMYERHFLGEMVKAMRSSVQKSDLIQESMADRIYSADLDREYVKSWVARGGVGLAQLIENQMLQQMGISPRRTPAIPSTREPASMFKLQQLPSSNEKRLDLQLESSDPQAKLELPWDGKWLHWFPKDPSASAKGSLLVNHGEFESLWQLAQKPAGEPGQKLTAGFSLAESLAPEGVRMSLRARILDRG